MSRTVTYKLTREEYRAATHALALSWTGGYHRSRLGTPQDIVACMQPTYRVAMFNSQTGQAILSRVVLTKALALKALAMLTAKAPSHVQISLHQTDGQEGVL